MIYGHNMKNLSMFGTLHYFENEDFFRENRYFFVLTPEEILVYDVFAAVEFSDDDLLRNYDFSDPDTFTAFMDTLYSLSGKVDRFRTETEVAEDSRVLALSTCVKNDTHERYIVFAKQL